MKEADPLKTSETGSLYTENNAMPSNVTSQTRLYVYNGWACSYDEKKKNQTEAGSGMG